MNTDPRFPVGKFKMPEMISADDRKSMIAIISDLPSALKMAVEGLSPEQLLVPYREGGWCTAQVVNHVADSHMNAYIRFKLGLTEINPTIKPYDEAAWAEMIDTKNLPVNIALTLLHALHMRWYEILKNMSEADLNKTIFHPEHKKEMTLWFLLGMYAWHSKHHTSHITS